MEDINELKTVTGQAQAQELLDAGWQLLGLFDRQEGANQWVEYHLGRPADDASTASGGVLLPKRMRP
ncbi:hypothetical protein D3C78_1812650 [compost metagenome]